MNDKFLLIVVYTGCMFFTTIPTLHRDLTLFKQSFWRLSSCKNYCLFINKQVLMLTLRARLFHEVAFAQFMKVIFQQLPIISPGKGCLLAVDVERGKFDAVLSG